ncbi:hypothetical protein [Alkanindiges illinoisensis]|uniref:hypothetical protein n=1 Tax=Alkanindiges illinoisensis TaxID=197183 RepID=UPI00047A7525|nr:hypothetical protein [Alkanindiges illinoisensis]
MDKKFVGIVLIVMIVGIGTWKFITYQVTKYQLNNAETKHECGYFERYEVRDESKGHIKFTTYIHMKTYSNKNLEFMFHGRFHKKISYIETDLKPGQKLCVDYIFPFLKEDGETFLKAIQVEKMPIKLQ